MAEDDQKNMVGRSWETKFLCLKKKGSYVSEQNILSL